MATLKFSSFAITIRPRMGVTPNSECEISLLKYFSKFEYSSVCFEKTGADRHLHAQVWFNDPKVKGDLMKQIRDRILAKTVPDWDNAQKKVACKIKIAYNDWFENYCAENETKGDPLELKFHNPPLETDSFYPSEEEQESIKNKANAKDPRFHHYKELYYERNKEKPKDTTEVARFLHIIMFIEKLIPVVIDKKARINICECLYYYLQDDYDPNDNYLIGINTFLSKEKAESAEQIWKAQQQIDWIQNE